MNRNRWKATASMLVAGVVLSACGTSEGASDAGAGESTGGDLASVSVGTTPILNAAPLYLGVEQGFFEDEGLEVTPQVIQAAATAVPSMLNGELDFALVSAVPTVTAHNQGIPVAFATGNDVYAESSENDGAAILVPGDSTMTTTADFGGTTIAVVGLKSAPELAVRRALREAGVDPSTVQFVEIPYSDMLSAVKDGRVDGALLVDPFVSQGLAQGLKAASYPFSEALPHETGLAWISVQPFLQENPETAAAFTRGMERAVQYAADHPDEVRRISAEYTSMPPEVIENVDVPVFDAELDDAKISTIAEMMAAEGFVEQAPEVDGLVWTP